MQRGSLKSRSSVHLLHLNLIAQLHFNESQSQIRVLDFLLMSLVAEEFEVF